MLYIFYACLVLLYIWNDAVSPESSMYSGLRGDKGIYSCAQNSIHHLTTQNKQTALIKIICEWSMSLVSKMAYLNDMKLFLLKCVIQGVFNMCSGMF